MIKRLAALKEPIKIGIIGCGAMGKGLFYQSLITPGIKCVGIADIDVGKIHEAIAELRPESGKPAVYEGGGSLAAAENIDVLIEASDSILPAGEFARTALKSGKHVIMMNAEADLAFGPELLALADANGAVYTSADGDQPAVISHLIRELKTWGLELVMAGNIKGFLDREATPAGIKSEADKRGLSAHMCCAMTDGTKLNIEMALLANAFDLRTARPGMMGPRAGKVAEVFKLFDLDKVRASGRPVVDFVLGAEPDGGVFVVGHCQDPYQTRMLKYYKMGDGPYYLFYRPYHLCHIETMLTVARAVLDKQGILHPDYGHKTNVYAYAKKELKAGESLDGIGGCTCYGLIENVDSGNDGIPIALSRGLKLKHDIKKGRKIKSSEVNT